MKKELKIILEGINQWEQGTRIRPMREQNRYVMIKQLIPGFKITRFCNFLVLYKYRGSHYFQKSQLYVKVYIKYIFPSFKFHLEKKGITRLLIGWHYASYGLTS